MTQFLDRLERLFAERGAAQYGGEAVSQLEHALQAAWEAEKDGATPELVVAALLHDIGHLVADHDEDAAEKGLDDHHEELGCNFLAAQFGPAVTEPIRLHVPAKRFLCSTEPAYLNSLSTASIRSLKLQGGPMTPDEAKEFSDHPYCDGAVRLRRWDELAKAPGLATPPFSHFRTYLEMCCGQPE